MMNFFLRSCCLDRVISLCVTADDEFSPDGSEASDSDDASIEAKEGSEFKFGSRPC